MSFPVGFPCSMPSGHGIQQKNTKLQQQREHVLPTAMLINISSHFILLTTTTVLYVIYEDRFCLALHARSMLMRLKKLQDKETQGGLC